MRPDKPDASARVDASGFGYRSALSNWKAVRRMSYTRGSKPKGGDSLRSSDGRPQLKILFSSIRKPIHPRALVWIDYSPKWWKEW
jgi:hypothetical protein